MKRFVRLTMVCATLASFAGVSAAHDDRADRWDSRGERWEGEDRRSGGQERWDDGQRRRARRADCADRSWERREARHDRRTWRGVRRGEITRGEARRLGRLDHRIERMIRRAWADGHLSARERVMISRAMRRDGRAIGRFNHNGRSYD